MQAIHTYNRTYIMYIISTALYIQISQQAHWCNAYQKTEHQTQIILNPYYSDASNMS